MTALTLISLVGALFALAIGFATTLGHDGYRFDLRKQSRRRGDDGRVGGRRAEDAA
jgi:hypothetical protein